MKEKIISEGTKGASKGKIVIATVKGDIHDIGKNIVKVILENYGYEMIDLGRDVPPERVVEAARSNNVLLVGLSALMTTTLPSMAQTIEALHQAGLPCKIMVGGAVLTPESVSYTHLDVYKRQDVGGRRLAIASGKVDFTGYPMLDVYFGGSGTPEGLSCRKVVLPAAGTYEWAEKYPEVHQGLSLIHIYGMDRIKRTA